MRTIRHGDTLEAVEQDGQVRISVRRVCEALELDFKSPHEKLRDKSWAPMVVFNLRPKLKPNHSPPATGTAARPTAAYNSGMEPVRCGNCESLQRWVHDQQGENERLRRQLDAALRAGKRQAGPFAKGEPKPNPRVGLSPERW